MIEALLESLDESVFTSDVKQSLAESFEAAVKAKSDELIGEAVEAKISELEEKAEEYKEILEAKSEEFVGLKEQEMLEQVDKYLERVVEEFVMSKTEELQAIEVSEKADLVVEAFDSLLVAAGVEVSSIVEAKEDNSAEAKLQEATAKNDQLVEEVIALKEQNDKMLKLGLIRELSEGLSIVESDKFKKLAELVPFSTDETYVEKLETIKESVTGKVSSEPEAQIDEAEAKPLTEKYSISHLL